MGGGASTIKALHTCHGGISCSRDLLDAFLPCLLPVHPRPFSSRCRYQCYLSFWHNCLPSFVKYDHFLLINPLDFEPFLLSLLCSVSAVTTAVSDDTNDAKSSATARGEAYTV